MFLLVKKSRNFKIPTFSKSRDFSKIRNFQNPVFFSKSRLSKSRDFSKIRNFQNPEISKTVIFNNPDFFFQKPRDFNVIKRTNDSVFSKIMAANTLGEFSDGEDDFVMEIDENLWEWCNSEDDDLIRNINEDEVLSGLYGNDDDELIRNINEDEVLTGLYGNDDDENEMLTEVTQNGSWRET